MPANLGDPAKEREFVSDCLRKRYRPWLTELIWVLSIGLLVIGSLAAWAWALAKQAFAEEWTLNVGASLALNAAIVVGVVILTEVLAAGFKRRNQRRKATLILKAKEDFEATGRGFGERVEDTAIRIRQLEALVYERDYGQYVALAESIFKSVAELQTKSDVLFSVVPLRFSEVRSSLKQVIARIESDQSAVLAYQPDILDTLFELRERGAARNVMDFRSAAARMDGQIHRLKERKEPFNFAVQVRKLEAGYAQLRDALLSDPAAHANWLSIDNLERLKYQDAKLAHCAALEARAKERQAAAAERQAEEAAKQTRLHEEIKVIELGKLDTQLKQLTAQRVDAAAQAVEAWHTRGIDKSLKKLKASDDPA